MRQTMLNQLQFSTEQVKAHLSQITVLLVCFHQLDHPNVTTLSWIPGCIAACVHIQFNLVAWLIPVRFRCIL